MSQHVPAALLVEDHPLMGQMMDRFLRAQGDIALWAIAASAEEALAKLAAAAGEGAGRSGTASPLPDLVLVDVSLAGASGIELVSELARLYPDLPALVVSAHRDQAYVRLALANGARGYVLKGHLDELLAAIDQVLRGQTYLSEEIRRP